jgi:YesN/AraC family two-component response regulator
MDILMPGVDGLDAIRAMRTVDPDCRIVVVSSCTEEHYRNAVRALCVEQFVVKPVRIDRVQDAVAAEMARPSPSSVERAAPFNMANLSDNG